MYSPPTFMNEGVLYHPDFYLMSSMIKQEPVNEDLLLTAGFYPNKNQSVLPFGVNTFAIAPDMYNCFTSSAASSPVSNYSYHNSPIDTTPHCDYFDTITNSCSTFTPQWTERHFYQPQPIATTSFTHIVKKSKRVNKNPDERPFQCTMCRRAFARKHDLQRHIRVHTGDKPYECPCCKKAFARTDALKRHLRMEQECRESQQVQCMKGTGKGKFRDL